MKTITKERSSMGFLLKQIDKKNESILDLINSDYHNGDCIIVQLSHELETIPERLKYIVADFPGYLLLIYNENPF